MTTPRIRLGQLLVDAKILTAEQLERVLATQKSDGRRLGTLLVESGFVTETQVTQILSQQLSVPWVSLHHIDFSRQLLNLVPRSVAEKFCLVPIYVRHVRKQGDTLYVAMDDPTNEAALEECRQWSGLPARAMIAAPSDIRNALRVYYGGARASVPPEARSSQPAASEPPMSLHESDIVASPPAPAVVETRRSSPPAEARSAEDALSPAPAASDPAIEPPPPSEAPASTPPAGSDRPAPVRSADDGPEVEVREVELPRRAKGKSSRMIALTFLDGTTITLPAARKRSGSDSPKAAPVTSSAASEESPPASERSPDSVEDQLTARDLVAALRAVAHGADATEILGENMKWEKMLAALLSVLLRKHLIADWEFVEELKKI